ncbi:Uncharacterized protein PBTT_04266 [Plasmodiophora brassicae]|uniref:Uncharacterized protein n=1 Tax=Plasmodiophora brassicae TaxID=37360 RepID=A0A0G4IGR3_PLABS|nr:hypothetical protein PBRA_000154 [Plasmodiophora brassicae]SPQ96718.1 unnamed protein product [Plasmodiophora brassicae]
MKLLWVLALAGVVLACATSAERPQQASTDQGVVDNVRRKVGDGYRAVKNWVVGEPEQQPAPARQPSLFGNLFGNGESQPSAPQERETRKQWFFSRFLGSSGDEVQQPPTQQPVPPQHPATTPQPSPVPTVEPAPQGEVPRATVLQGESSPPAPGSLEQTLNEEPAGEELQPQAGASAGTLQSKLTEAGQWLKTKTGMLVAGATVGTLAAGTAGLRYLHKQQVARKAKTEADKKEQEAKVKRQLKSDSSVVLPGTAAALAFFSALLIV